MPIATLMVGLADTSPAVLATDPSMANHSLATEEIYLRLFMFSNFMLWSGTTLDHYLTSHTYFMGALKPYVLATCLAIASRNADNRHHSA